MIDDHCDYDHNVIQFAQSVRRHRSSQRHVLVIIAAATASTTEQRSVNLKLSLTARLPLI